MASENRPSPIVYFQNTASSGRGAFASQDIPAGSLVLEISNPLICIPDDAHLDDCCSYCMSWKPSSGASSVAQSYTDDAPLSYCLGCKVVKYCGKVCCPSSAIDMTISAERNP